MEHLRVHLAGESSYQFENPTDVLEAFDLESVRRGLERAEAHLQAGRWIAGYLAYDLGLVLLGMRRESRDPLLVLGAFRQPLSAAVLTRPPKIEQHTGTATLAPLLPTLTRAQYDASVAAIQRAIYDGDVYQVNFTLPFHTHLSGDAHEFWQRIARATGARYQAYVERDERALLSWSPELFLAFDGERIETRPMKGTAPLERIAELTNPKNRAEHVMIVDLLRNDLHRFCDDVRVDALASIERYPTFATSISRISGRLRAGSSLLDIFTATFPCGSVTGAPKRAAMDEIERREAQPRGVYCGSIGFLSPQRRGWWSVAIRTAQINLRTGAARFDVGGAIVADSRADDEWREIELKTLFLRKHLIPLDILETFAGGSDAKTREQHATRVLATAAAFRIPVNPPQLAAAIDTTREESAALIRIRIHRTGALQRSSEPLDTPSEPVRITLCEERVRSDDPYLAYKTSYRPIHDWALRYARSRNCFDALLRNERGELTEGARTNLFVRIGGTLWTPPLASGLLDGILRRQLIGQRLARERTLALADLNAADEIYVGNSARGLLRATLVDDA